MASKRTSAGSWDDPDGTRLWPTEAEAAVRRADIAARRAEVAVRRAEVAAHRAEVAVRRAEAAEAENRRLKALLGPEQ